MKATVVVTQTIEVEVDETKFTPEFMAEFREHFYNFHTMKEHVGHLGQLYARDLVDEYTIFIEGYGDVKKLGIVFNAIDIDVGVES